MILGPSSFRCARAHWLCPTEAYTSGHRRLGGASRLLLLLLLSAACSWEAAAAAATLQHGEGGGALRRRKHESNRDFCTKHSGQTALGKLLLLLTAACSWEAAAVLDNVEKEEELSIDENMKATYIFGGYSWTDGWAGCCCCCC